MAHRTAQMVVVFLGFMCSAVLAQAPKIDPVGPLTPVGPVDRVGPVDPVGPMRPVGPPTVRGPEDCEYKVVYWYDKENPKGTLKYQVYDIRKREFTKDVADWVKKVEFTNPNLIAYQKDVYLGDESGITEKEKLDAAIGREKRRVDGLKKWIQPPWVSPPGDVQQNPIRGGRVSPTPNPGKHDLTGLTGTWYEWGNVADGYGEQFRADGTFGASTWERDGNRISWENSVFRFVGTLDGDEIRGERTTFGESGGVKAPFTYGRR